jgi:hypothetical protein
LHGGLLAGGCSRVAPTSATTTTTITTTAAAAARYFLLACVGMWAFGVFNSGSNMLLNFHDSTAVRVFLVVSAATGYLPITFGQILLFLKFELKWKVGTIVLGR